MHVYRYSTHEEPGGAASWGFRVTDDSGCFWDVLVRRDAPDLYSWVIPQDFRHSIRERGEMYRTREEALDAALSWIRRHGARGTPAIAHFSEEDVGNPRTPDARDVVSGDGI